MRSITAANTGADPSVTTVPTAMPLIAIDE
jgi:hypothetical protein